MKNLVLALLAVLLILGGFYLFRTTSNQPDAQAELIDQQAAEIEAIKTQLANAEEIATLKAKLANAERETQEAERDAKVEAARQAWQDVPKGRILKRTYNFKEANQAKQEYALYVPTTYQPGTLTPLAVVLHGLGSTPQQIIRYQGLTAEAEKRGYIVVAPFGFNRNGWYGSLGQGNTLGFKIPEEWSRMADLREDLGKLSEKDVLNVLDLVIAGFSVDPNRIYLMGHSMGGAGTLYLGMKYHETWAALAPLAPASTRSPDELAKAPSMPIFVAQGELDNLVPVRKTRALVAKMKELGMTHEYVEVKGGDHTSMIARSPKLMSRMFDFFDEHPRP